MEITITPELEKLIDEEMKTGDYFSPTDVLREGLISLKTRRIPRKERLENLYREVQKGIDAVRNGDCKTYNSAEEMMEEVLQEARFESEADKDGK